MNVLVTGGTGFVGTSLCRELDRRGHDVTALARHPEEADFAGTDVETAAGDVTARDSLREPMADAEAVVNLVALSPLFEPRGGKEAHFEVHLRGTENVVRVAERQGVDRHVQLSALEADPDGPTAYLRAKGQAEQVVRDADLDWTVFRPSIMFGEGDEIRWFTRLVAPPYVTPLPGGGKTPFQLIWVEDAAPMYADAAADEAGDHAGETYEIGGPDVWTLAQVARLVHAVRGRPTNVLSIPMPLVRAGLTLLDAVPYAPMGRDQYRGLTQENVTDDNDVDAFGVSEDDLRTLPDYLDVDRSAAGPP